MRIGDSVQLGRLSGAAARQDAHGKWKRVAGETMHLETCTLTGIDETTSIPSLIAASRQFENVEWGILYSPKRQGKPGRYPSVGWIVTVIRAFQQEKIRHALHVCGVGVPAFLSNSGSVASGLLAILFEGRELARAQFNFDAVADWIEPEEFAAAMRRLPLQGRQIPGVICQYKPANMAFHAHMTRIGDPNYSVLIDASGGRGVVPEAWPAPPDVPHGYAGGFGPENLEARLRDLSNHVDESVRTWIDMEGKLRSVDENGVDRFDIEKARACLEIVARRENAFSRGATP